MIEWQWDYGEYLKFFKEKAELGLATPLDSAPVVDQAQLFYVNAFKILDNSKQGVRIGLTEIEAYTKLFTVSDIILFVKIIQELDQTLMRLRKSDNRNKHKD